MTDTISNLRKGWRGVWKQYPTDSDVQDIVDVKNDFGAVGDGVTDDSSAFTLAIASGFDVFIPPGTYLVNNLTLNQGQAMFGLGRNSILKKNDNGPVVTLARDTDVSDFAIDGEGGTYTGTGIEIPATAEYEGQQRVDNLYIYDTASYCIEYTGQFSGFGSTIVNCILSPLNYLTTPCVKLSGLETATNHHGDRTIIACECNGPIVDATSSNVTYVTNCISGDSGLLGPVICDDNTGKLFVTGCRLVGPLTINGYDHCWNGNVHSSTVVFDVDTAQVNMTGSTISGDCTLNGDNITLTGCNFAGTVTVAGNYNTIGNCQVINGNNLTVSSGATNNRIADTLITGTFTDSSGSATNHYDLGPTAYTPSWTAATSAPAIGDGSISGLYSRHGRLVSASLTVTMGASSTYGDGIWYFSLPFIPSTTVTQHGPAVIFDNGTAYYPGVLRTLTDGTARCVLFGSGGGEGTGSTGVGSQATSAEPFAWASGDQITATIVYST